MSASKLSPAGNPWQAAPEGATWLRGNLHCHTTNSDGRLSPQEAVDWFAGAGYQLLALTDHDVVTDPAALNAGGMCLLTATELTAAGAEMGGTYHLVSLGLPSGAVLPPATTPVAEAVRFLSERGAVVFVAHPHWSGLTVSDVRAATDAGAHGLEIYNGGTVLDSQRGEALAHWDEGLGKGARWWGVATDDTHWHTIDRALGWVMVRAAGRSPEAVLEALATGCFYSSCGPEITHVSVESEDGVSVRVDVETSPCAAIYLLPFGARSQIAFNAESAARGETGGTITTATFHASQLGPGGYVRIQCTDWQRRSAWSNPLFIAP